MRGQHQQAGLPSVRCARLPPLTPCQRSNDTDEKNIWPPLPSSDGGSSLRSGSQAHSIYFSNSFLKWAAQQGFPFILLYYFQIKLSPVSCSRTMKTRLRGIGVASQPVARNRWAPHLGQGAVDNPWTEAEVRWWQRGKRGDPDGLFSSGVQSEDKSPWSSTL